MKLKDLKRVYFCSGARNADLLNRLEEHAELIFHFEEREASFRALGEAKASGDPIGICVTSGTAVLECLPAFAEAYYSGARLVLISADRPRALRSTGAAQTLDQVTPFKTLVRTSLEVTLDNLDELSFSEFPAQINIEINLENISVQQSKAQKISVSAFMEQVGQYSHPLFIVSHTQESLAPLVDKLIQFNQAVFVEPLSQFDWGKRSQVLWDERLVERHLADFDCIVRLGETPLASFWRRLELSSVPIFHMDPRGLEALSHGFVLQEHPLHLLESEKFWEHLASIPTAWNKKSLVPGLLNEFPQSEPALVATFLDSIPESHWIFLGNSLPIREFQLVASKKYAAAYGNRGLNGIDGNISTAIGIAQRNKNQGWALIGDLTLLYDFRSLMDLPKNLNIAYIQNGGGQIFPALGMSERLANKYSREISLPNSSITEIRPDLEQTMKFYQLWSYS